MTFDSVYSLLTPPAVVRKQRFWDWFDGDALRNFWNVTDYNGSGGSAIMEDVLDRGLRIIPGASNANEVAINFNNIRQYAHDGLVFISTNLRGGTSRALHTGLTETASAANRNNTYIRWRNDTNQTFIDMLNGVNASNTITTSSLSVDTAWHVYKGELRSASALGWIDGILEAISTTNLPDVVMQPNVVSINRSAGAKANFIRYYEVYNT